MREHWSFSEIEDAIISELIRAKSSGKDFTQTVSYLAGRFEISSAEVIRIYRKIGW